MSDTLTLILVLVPSLVIAIVFHEVAHGWVANALGDPTAREQRRLTLNPVRHVDPVGTLLVPGLLALANGPVFGWAKPVPVIKERLRSPRWGMVAVAAAGPGINFAMAAAAAVIMGLALRALAAGADAPWLAALLPGLDLFILINIFIALFNLLPIPPFDGSHIVEGVLPRRAAAVYGRLRPFGMALFFGLIALTWFVPQWGLLERVVLPPVEGAHALAMQIAGLVRG
ncbi:site-2 protease family protein [Erythrobacteraceae bacterium CFH 75059]|uniref:site-2 protease family protein n=1 Tax=Qipengyuania thermophila TaxID=2509361 RepID=UPI00101F3139|nr:site-2 protease family protein [Qipengyuania thermophila]TCD04774.1 site-2 protease family protein [Erythrobacteraceae bacterium CFH 75059]